MLFKNQKLCQIDFFSHALSDFSLPGFPNICIRAKGGKQRIVVNPDIKKLLRNSHTTRNTLFRQLFPLDDLKRTLAVAPARAAAPVPVATSAGVPLHEGIPGDNGVFLFLFFRVLSVYGRT